MIPVGAVIIAVAAAPLATNEISSSDSVSLDRAAYYVHWTQACFGKSMKHTEAEFDRRYGERVARVQAYLRSKFGEDEINRVRAPDENRIFVGGGCSKDTLTRYREAFLSLLTKLDRAARLE